MTTSRLFQLTRSVGSVTENVKRIKAVKLISTHTLRGERDNPKDDLLPKFKISTHTLRGERDDEVIPYDQFVDISTHTLRGERDCFAISADNPALAFQLTRSVGSVTVLPIIFLPVRCHFNSHAPWGA